MKAVQRAEGRFKNRQISLELPRSRWARFPSAKGAGSSFRLARPHVRTLREAARSLESVRNLLSPWIKLSSHRIPNTIAPSLRSRVCFVGLCARRIAYVESNAS